MFLPFLLLFLLFYLSDIIGSSFSNSRQSFTFESPRDSRWQHLWFASSRLWSKNTVDVSIDTTLASILSSNIYNIYILFNTDTAAVAVVANRRVVTPLHSRPD